MILNGNLKTEIKKYIFKYKTYHTYIFIPHIPPLSNKSTYY